MTLSKKKAGNVQKQSVEEKRILKSLDGNGKSIDKNLELLKNMLQLIEIDLRDEIEENEEIKDEDSEQELRSISFKNTSIAQIESAPYQAVINNEPETTQNKRFKAFESEEYEEEKKSSLSDDVNFHEIPTTPPCQSLDMMDKKVRQEAYQKMYMKRHQQKLEGKWNPKLSSFTKLIFSYPQCEQEDMERKQSEIKNDMTFDNINRCPSSLSFFSEKVRQQNNKQKIGKGLKIDTGEQEHERQDNQNDYLNQETPNYGVEDDVFTYTIQNTNREKEKVEKGGEFKFTKPPPLKSPNYQNKDLQILTPTINQAMNPIKPMVSPSNMNNYNEMMYYNIQTPARTQTNHPFNMFSRGSNALNPVRNFAKIFATDDHPKDTDNGEYSYLSDTLIRWAIHLGFGTLILSL